MSAYVVSKEHVDALVTAGLAGDRIDGPLRWFWPPITVQDRESAGRPGVTMTEGDVILAESRNAELRDDTASRVGAMLWGENFRSVGYRYNEPEDSDDLPGPVGLSVLEVAGYEYEFNGGFSPVEILSALSCFEYQSCEHPGWVASEAYAFCDALRGRMIRKLPGYENAPWEISERRQRQYGVRVI